MADGWICPKCGRALAPWMPECPCNNIKTVTSSKYIVTSSDGKCPYVCPYKTEHGYCQTTGCINPEYNGNGNTVVYDKAQYDAMRMAADPDYGRGNNA